VFDLTTRTDTIKIFTECRRRQLFYFNTDLYTEMENEKPCVDLSKCLIDSSIYFMQMNMKDAAHKTRRFGNQTTIIECGMNPGLISIFIKQGIIDMAKLVLSKKHDPILKTLLRKKDFGNICKRLKVRVIHCSELDTQVAHNEAQLKKNKKLMTNTWSCLGFIDEGSEPCEIAIGTHEKIIPLKQENVRQIIQQVVLLEKEGRKTQFVSYVPEYIQDDGTAKFTEITGVCVHHGEGISFNEYIGTDDYAPTMHYVYKPSPSVENPIRTRDKTDLFEMSKNSKNWRVMNVYEDNLQGTDNVGALFILETNPITGENKPWGYWIGSVLNTDYTKNVLKDPYFGPTTIQVMAGLVSGLAWALKHPNEGMIYTDIIDTKFILSMIKKYLGVFYSGQVTGVDIAGYTIDKLMVDGRDAKHTVIHPL
jgi:homospermidine synthase